MCKKEVVRTVYIEYLDQCCKMLISRRLSQWICGFGVVQMMFATGLAVCGFVVLGLFHNLDCKGIWLGLPMLVPGVLSLLVSATRHRSLSLLVCATNIGIIAIGALHVVRVWDHTDYWEKYRKLSEYEAGSLQGNPCYDRGDMCVCTDRTDYDAKGYTVQYCDQFRTGEEIFWTLIALTFGGLLFSLLNAILGLSAFFAGLTKEDEEDEYHYPVDYEMPGGKQNYALHQ